MQLFWSCAGTSRNVRHQQRFTILIWEKLRVGQKQQQLSGFKYTCDLHFYLIFLLTFWAHMEDSPNKHLLLSLNAPFHSYFLLLLELTLQYALRLRYNTDCLVASKICTGIKNLGHYLRQCKSSKNRKREAKQPKRSQFVPKLLLEQFAKPNEMSFQNGSQSGPLITSEVDRHAKSQLLWTIPLAEETY